MGVAPRLRSIRGGPARAGWRAGAWDASLGLDDPTVRRSEMPRPFREPVFIAFGGPRLSF